MRKHPGFTDSEPAFAGAKGLIEVEIDNFLDIAVKGMVENCPTWDETLVKINTLQTLSENFAVYQYVSISSTDETHQLQIYDPGRAFFLLSQRDMVYYNVCFS